VNSLTPFAIGSRSRFVFLVAALLLVGVTVRLLGWDHWSLWLDETMQVDYARRPFLEILRASLWDGAHPPLSYLVTALSVRVSSFDAVLRFPSVLFSMGAALALFVEGGGFRRFRPAFASAALFTVLPVSVHYGQEVRPYALALFLVALSAAARRRFAETSSHRAVVLHILAATGAVYTLYFAVFPICAGFIYDVVAALRSRKENPIRLRWALTAPVAVFILYLPWLVALWGEPRPTPVMSAPRVTARLVGAFAVGLAADRQEEPARAGPAVFVWSLAILGMLVGRGRRAEIVLQFLASFAAPLVFLLSIHHWWNLRYILLAVLPLSQSFGQGVEFVARRAGWRGGWVLGVVLVVLCAIEAPAIAANVRWGRVDWRRPAAYLEWQFRSGRSGAVLAADDWSWWVLRFQTLRLKPPIEVGPIAVNGQHLHFLVQEKGAGWIIRTPHHPVPPDADQFLARVAPWGVFVEAENSRLYRFEHGRLIPP
jgi:hypothetical protein